MRDFLLTPERIRELAAVADSWRAGKHHASDRHNRHKEKPAGEGFTSRQADIVGIKGQFVASEIYGVPFDRQAYGMRGDSGVDIYTPLPGGVKTSHRKYGLLIIEFPRDLDPIDVLHLVTGSCDPSVPCACGNPQPSEAETWRYVGWISVEDFRERMRVTDWGYGTRWSVPQSELNTTRLCRTNPNRFETEDGCELA